MAQSLTQLLKDLLGSENVYFKPPEGFMMQYPCIVYSRYGLSRVSADNMGYSHTWRYQVTVIDRDPDNPVLDKLPLLSKCSFIRHFETEGLNHDVFELYH